MNPALRNFLVTAASAVVAIAVGAQIAQAEHFWASAIGGLSLWAVFSWVGRARTEAWLLGFLVFGYVIGNRGFAQITPVPGLPLFFGEFGLGFAVPLLLLRGAMARVSPWSRTAIGAWLAFWLACGGGRIVFDVRAHGINALRDFATLYYALFFFVTVALCRHAPSQRVLRGALTLTFAALPVTTLLADLFPRFFLTNLLVKGVPLILYKEDLAATYGFVGFLWLLPQGQTDFRRSWWRWLAAALLLANGLLGLSRASLVGLLIGAGWLAFAGWGRPLRTIAAVCAAGLLAVGAYSALQRTSFERTKAYAVYEAAASIVDFSGTRTYVSGYSNDKGDNNRFRLVWWRNVAEETWRTSPLLGLGFGADLSRGFAREYYPDGTIEFAARSPHNVFVTMFGRLGLLGVASLLAIYLRHAWETARVMRAARNDGAQETPVKLFAMTWVVLVSACFGVVLEGPMGAVPFWIVLGLAYAGTAAPKEDARVAAAAETRQR